MADLKNIIESMSETPSEHCWEQIAQQLNAVMPTQVPTSEAIQPTTSSVATQMSVHTVSSVSLKTIISWIIVGSLVISLVIGGALWLSSSIDNSSPLQNNSQLITINVDSVRSDSVSNVDVVIKNEFVKKTIDSIVVIDKEIPQVSHSIISSEEISMFVEDKSVLESECTSSNPQDLMVDLDKDSVREFSEQTNVELLNEINREEDRKEKVEELLIELRIPNIFTPNNDGLNDVFEIENLEYCTESRLIIRDGKGRVVLDKLNYANDWQGDDLPEGVYYYVFSYTLQGKTRSIRGNLTLKRSYIW